MQAFHLLLGICCEASPTNDPKESTEAYDGGIPSALHHRERQYLPRVHNRKQGGKARVVAQVVEVHELHKATSLIL